MVVDGIPAPSTPSCLVKNNKTRCEEGQVLTSAAQRDWSRIMFILYFNIFVIFYQLTFFAFFKTAVYSGLFIFNYE